MRFKLKNLTVSLELNNSILVAEIHGAEGGDSVRYAFYLMRGREKISVLWYSRSPIAKFSVSDTAGVFHVIGFVKTDSSTPPVFKLSNSIGYKSNSLYDLYQWGSPVLENESLEFIENGIYRFRRRETFIDIKVEGVEFLKPGGSALVCFGGAVTERTRKMAPFFSGSGIAKNLKLPILSIADPTLYMAQDLSLAWYAGNNLIPSLQSDLAEILDKFSQACKTKLILFGGSGGGFAALAIQSFMNTNPSVFVWNPQTSISKYGSNPVNLYLKYAFPNEFSSERHDSFAVLQSAGVIHDLNVSFLQRSKVLYVQNISDSHHVDSHAKPFLESQKMILRDQDVFYKEKGFAVWLGSWGKGHVAPPSNIINFALSALAEDRLPLDIALELRLH